MSLDGQGIVVIRDEIQSLVSGVLEPLDGVGQETNAAQKAGRARVGRRLATALVIVVLNLPLVPDGDGHGVGGTEEQVIVRVPLGIQARFHGLRAVGLAGSVHRDPDKGIR